MRPIRTKNYTNLAKKLLPLTGWTIIIAGLVIRIIGRQSQIKGAGNGFNRISEQCRVGKHKCAAAKTAGELDIALECAMTGDCDPDTLLRAARDFAEKDSEFALKVGIEAVMIYLTGSFYDPIAPIDIRAAFTKLMSAAGKSEGRQWVRTELSKRVLRESNRIKHDLRETILELLKQETQNKITR